MKKLEIYEPAMCCPTGLCGVGIDPELIRISSVLDILTKNEIKVERYNLSNDPQAFVSNQVVNQYIRENGVEGLPVLVQGNEIVITGRYPTNEELASLLSLSLSIFGEVQEEPNATEESEGCCCSGGCCE